MHERGRSWPLAEHLSMFFHAVERRKRVPVMSSQTKKSVSQLSLGRLTRVAPEQRPYTWGSLGSRAAWAIYSFRNLSKICAQRLTVHSSCCSSAKPQSVRVTWKSAVLHKQERPLSPYRRSLRDVSAPTSHCCPSSEVPAQRWSDVRRAGWTSCLRRRSGMLAMSLS